MDKIFDWIHKLGWLAVVVSQSGFIPDPVLSATILKVGLLLAGGQHVVGAVVDKLKGTPE